MEDNEERYRQFKEKIEREMRERKALDDIAMNSFYFSLLGAFVGGIPYIGWPYLIFSFCYCCYAWKKTWSSIPFFSIIICIVMLGVKYIIATS